MRKERPERGFLIGMRYNSLQLSTPTLLSKTIDNPRLQANSTSPTTWTHIALGVLVSHQPVFPLMQVSERFISGIASVACKLDRISVLLEARSMMSVSWSAIPSARSSVDFEARCTTH